MYESIQIDTTQNVSLHFTKASLGDRIVSFGIDIIIKVLYYGIVILVAIMAIGQRALFNGDFNEMFMFALLLAFLPVLTYDLMFEYLMDGQTLGKKIMKIKVVNLNGNSLSLSSIILRWLFRSIDFFPLFYGLVGLISIAASKNSQRLGDLVAGTGVIKVKNLVELRDTVFQMLEEDHKAEFPQVTRLSSRDIEIIKQVLNKEEYRNNQDVVQKLFYKIKTMLDIETDYDAITFLKKVVDDYTYYA